MGPKLVGVLGTLCLNPMSILCGVIMCLLLRLVLFCRNVFSNSRQDSRLMGLAVPGKTSTLSLLPAVGGGRVHRNCQPVWVPTISGLMSKTLVMMGCLTQTNACSLIASDVHVRDSVSGDVNFCLYLILFAAILLVLRGVETLGHRYMDQREHEKSVLKGLEEELAVDCHKLFKRRMKRWRRRQRKKEGL